MPSPRTIQNHKQVREAGFTARQTVMGMGGSPRQRFLSTGKVPATYGILGNPGCFNNKDSKFQLHLLFSQLQG